MKLTTPIATTNAASYVYDAAISFVITLLFLIISHSAHRWETEDAQTPLALSLTHLEAPEF